MNSRQRTITITISIICIFTILFRLCFIQRPTYHAAHLTETSSVLKLPYCGFYHLYGYQLSEENTEKAVDWCNQMLTYDSQSIILLQINLCNYANSSLSSNALEQLDCIFRTFSRANKQIILRFLYDWEGKALETEPKSIQQIVAHMEQVAPIVNRYDSHIFLLQGVFTGNCGEMNQTHYGTNENIIQLAEQLSRVISKNIFLSVRTPAHLRTITKTNEALSELNAYDGSLYSRLGLYNDGMLGNDFDCGTYDDTSFSVSSDYTEKGTREEELSFQEKVCQFVPNGGEVVLPNSYNDLENAIADLSRMHVSYLSCDHDARVLDKWKSTTYHGTNGYDYIAARLGYHYVLEHSQMQTDSFFHKEIVLSTALRNDGFSPAYRKFDFSFVFKDNTGKEITIPISYDNRTLMPKQTTSLTATITLKNLKKGKYQVSLIATDKATKQSIPFANKETEDDNSIPCGVLQIR